MAQELVRYTEPLEVEEIKFLQKKVGKERKLYYKVLTILMAMSFLIPFAGSWYRAYEGAPNAFSMPRYFASTFVLTFISSFSVWASYRYNLRKIVRDLRDRTKTIECTRITRKMYMPHNNTYFFYIDSPNKLSIEVTVDDYHYMNLGDEINIEYTSNAKYYLGYH